MVTAGNGVWRENLGPPTWPAKAGGETKVAGRIRYECRPAEATAGNGDWPEKLRPSTWPA